MDDLQAGRELDALVAEKVMGWESVAMAGLFTQFPATALCGLPPGAQMNADLQVVPRYSTHIAAAWEVITQMRKIGFGFTISDNGNRFAEHIDCRFWVLKDDMRRGIAIEGDASLAICKAALRAVGQCE